MNKRRRVVVTGVGIVSPNGIGKEECYKNMINGVSNAPLNRKVVDLVHEVEREKIFFHPDEIKKQLLMEKVL